MSIFARHCVAAMLMLMLCGVLSASVRAQPAIVHEEQRVALPEQYFDPMGACLMGDDLLVLATRVVSNPIAAWTVVRFGRQASGEWQFVEELAAVDYDSGADIWIDEKLACEGEIAGFSAPHSRLDSAQSFILERTPSGWVATSVPINAADVAVHGNSVAFSRRLGGSPIAAVIYSKDSSGGWTIAREAIGHPGFNEDVELEGAAEIALGSTELAATGLSYVPSDQSEHIDDTQVFDLTNGPWQLTDTLPGRNPVTTIGDRVAVRLDQGTEPGEIGSFFMRDASGAWAVEHAFFSDEQLSLGSDTVIETGRAFARVGPFLEGRVAVFAEEQARRYRHDATLLPSNDHIGAFSVDGERVAAVGVVTGDIYLFEIPQTLPASQLIEETFEDNDAADWSAWGSADWRIVSSGGSRVFRQHDTQGGARAILDTFESGDQAIQADVRVQSGAGPAPWVGLMVRYTDPENFYYLLVDNTSVQIRSIVNGAYGPLATAPFDLVQGQTYRFRLEAVGDRIRAYVNDEVLAEALDDTHASGKVGLTMWRSVTEYDNVVVTSRPLVSLFADSFQFSESPLPWATTPSNAWNLVDLGNNVRVYRQSMTTRSTHAINGAPTGDQIVAVKVRPLAFDSSGRGSVGVILRYVDYRNFYYARLTDSNTILLGMQIDGVHHAIDHAALSVNPATLYNLRAEAIGSSLRVYVNDTLMAEGQDSTFEEGRYGLVTFEASADFDDFDVVRP